jgi:hypothetical protein
MKRFVTMLAALSLLAIPAQAQAQGLIQGRTPTGRNQPVAVSESGILSIANGGTVTAPTSGPGVETTTPITTATLATNGTLATWEFTGFRGLSFSINGVSGQGTVTPQCSNDNTNWLNCTMLVASTGAYTTSSQSTAQGFYFPATTRYGRLVLSAWISGTWSITGYLRNLNIDPGQISGTVTAANTTGNVANGATDSGNPLKIGCVANGATPTAVVAGQRVNSWCGLNGQTIATLTGAASAMADGISNGATLLADNSGSGIRVIIRPEFYNGNTWDRAKGDVNGLYVQQSTASAAAIGTLTIATSAVSGGLVVKATAGNLYGLNIATGATAGYLMVFNSATVPADGAVTPIKCFQIAANTSIDLPYRSAPLGFTTGISAAFSSTGCFTKTTSATAFMSADYR